MNSFLLEIGQKIKNHREKKNMTLSELVKRTKIKMSVLKKIENGENEYRFHTLVKIINALEINLEDFRKP